MLDFESTLGYDIKVHIHIDKDAHEVLWDFQTIDPKTGNLYGM